MHIIYKYRIDSNFCDLELPKGWKPLSVQMQRDGFVVVQFVVHGINFPWLLSWNTRLTSALSELEKAEVRRAHSLDYPAYPAGRENQLIDHDGGSAIIDINLRDVIQNLRDCQDNPDIEAAHCKADELLCGFLKYLGYHDVVREFEKIDKHYA